MRAANRQQKSLDPGFYIRSPKDKIRVLATLIEIEEVGHTLPAVWETFKRTPQPQASCTLQDALKEFLAAKESLNRRPKTIRNLRWYLGKFIRGRKKRDVNSITEVELDKWFTKRREAPRSRQGHVSLLSSFFDHCWRRRYIVENPVKRLDRVHVDFQTPAILTNRQALKAVLFVLRRRPKLLGWLVLTLFCGLRPNSEADFMDWEGIDLEKGRIIIKHSKVRHVRHRIIDLAFCPPALEWLRVAKPKGAPLPIHFESRRRGLRALRDHLGFKRWPQDILRHTAASNLLALHQDVGKVAAFLGNSTGVLLRSYKALVFKEDAEKFMRITPKPRHYNGKTVIEIESAQFIRYGTTGGKASGVARRRKSVKYQTSMPDSRGELAKHPSKPPQSVEGLALDL